jgi:predicted ATP-dependent endonuclease of OLD family
MRIRRIVLNDFRGFPGQANYGFQLDGANLLLFGENGSGKSSLFVALREFFDLKPNPAPFDRFRNVFTLDGAGHPLTCGRVARRQSEFSLRSETSESLFNLFLPHYR